MTYSPLWNRSTRTSQSQPKRGGNTDGKDPNAQCHVGAGGELGNIFSNHFVGNGDFGLIAGYSVNDTQQQFFVAGAEVGGEHTVCHHSRTEYRYGGGGVFVLVIVVLRLIYIGNAGDERILIFFQLLLV